MKFRAIFQFELKYQLRSLATWIYFAITFLFPIFLAVIGKPTDDTYANAPSLLIFVTVFGGIIWLSMAGAVAGHAAARDVQTRLFPLIYAAPVSKTAYLGGRFLAAFLINACTLLTIPVGFLLVQYMPGLKTGLLGPFRPEAYLTTYFYLALPLTFIATAIQFAVANLARRAIAGIVISIVLFPFMSQLIGTTVASLFKNWELAKLIDLVGVSIIADMETWTLFEKNNRLIRLKGAFLYGRLLWLGFALTLLTYTYFRFKFAHPVTTTWRSRFKRTKKKTAAATSNTAETRPVYAFLPVQPSFNLFTHVSQIKAIAGSSFRMIAQSKAGFTIMGLFALHLVLFASEYLKLRGVPQYPTTVNVLGLLMAPVNNIKTPLIIIPLLIIFYAGELVWREREANLNKISDSVPVSEWAFFGGKFLGLGLAILVWLGFLMLAGISIQASLGYEQLEINLYFKTLFGVQLINYLLFALLALVVHVLINQKYLGHLVILIIYLYLVFHARLGIEHNLLIYGSDPGFSYTDMRGFTPYLVPWLWFKLYWVGWALLLAVAARLLWVRSLATSLLLRVQLMRQRFTGATAGTTCTALGLILFTGSYIFYNTNVLNNYTSTGDLTIQTAQYELKYRKYKNVPQPLLVGTKLRVDIYPKQRKATIRGVYRLVNNNPVAIDTIHLATIPSLETNNISFNQDFSPVLTDNKLGHRIYVLQKPLPPGGSLNLKFVVQYQPQGFPSKEIDALVISNGTYFINYDWLPAIGYQANRELRSTVDRKKYKLPPKSYPALHNRRARQVMPGQELITFEAIISTEAGQTAIAPGTLLRKWTQNNRHYFHYGTSAPIRNTYSFFSARYATYQTTWKQVAIRFYYHPQHREHLNRMVKSVKASLCYFTAQFGPYPYTHLTIMERSGLPGELNAEPTTIDYGESFVLSNIRDNPASLNVIYFALAHEVAHQWWGAAQLIPAHMEGGLLLSETLANYSGLQVLEESYGKEQVRKLLSMWRDAYEVPRSRATAPLLRATDPFLGYRKGPLALYALTQYIGKKQVNIALRQLIQKHGSGQPPLPTSLDLYQELKAVTPDSLHYLLQDYFEKNIYWQLKTLQSTARQTTSGKWEVTLKLEAQKVVVDTNGAEIPVPMQDWVEVGILAPRKKEEQSGRPLYLQKHRLKSGEQTITVTVPEKPARAGIDPNYLLIDLDLDNNTQKVKLEGENKEEPEGLI